MSTVTNSELDQKFYDQHWKNTSKTNPSKELGRIELTCSAVPSGSKRILDVGCGDGRLSQAIRRQQECFLVGFDLSSVALSQLDEPTCCGSAVQLPFCDRSFDLVVSTEMMEHVPHEIYTAVIREIARVAKHSILITVPNNENLSENLAMCGSCGSYYHIWGHQRSYTIPELNDLFDQFRLVRGFAFGEQIESYNKILLWIRQKVAGGFVYEERTLCYYCQSSHRSTPRLATLERFCNSLNSRLWTPFARRPGWLLGLYSRRDQSGK